MRPRSVQRDVERVTRGESRRPHDVLGVHAADGGGYVLRAWRPDASAIRCLVDGEVAAKLELVHPAGLFEGSLDERPDDYLLEVDYGDGQTFTLRDPYAFEPTLGDLDLHLLGEGSHRRLWEKLGAHPHQVSGVAGVAFAGAVVLYGRDV